MKTSKLSALIAMPPEADIRDIANQVLNNGNEKESIEDKVNEITDTIMESIKITVIGTKVTEIKE